MDPRLIEFKVIAETISETPENDHDEFRSDKTRRVTLDTEGLNILS